MGLDVLNPCSKHRLISKQEYLCRKIWIKVKQITWKMNKLKTMNLETWATIEIMALFRPKTCVKIKNINDIGKHHLKPKNMHDYMFRSVKILIETWKYFEIGSKQDIIYQKNNVFIWTLCFSYYYYKLTSN